jgi:hypothetical protein
MILNLNDKRESVKLNIQDIKGGKIGKLIKFYFIFLINLSYFEYFFGGLECVGHFFAYLSHFVILSDVWIRTQRADVANSRATHLPNLATHLPF